MADKEPKGVTVDDLTTARDACLMCLAAVRETRGAVEGAWAFSGLMDIQFKYIAAAAPEKHGWLDGSRPRRPDDPLKKLSVVWLTPEDTSLSRDEVLAVWNKLEPEIIGPLEKFENSVVDIFEEVGKIFKLVRRRLIWDVNDVILLAAHDTVNIPDTTSTTCHEAAMKAALQVLSVSGTWNDLDALWPEGENYLRETLETLWHWPHDNSLDRYLKRFLAHQGWMLDIENPERRSHDPSFGFPEFDTATVEREIMFEWAAAVRMLEEKKTADPSANSRDRLIDSARVAELVGLQKRAIEFYRKDWPTPDIANRGRVPAKWCYQQLLPKLKEQFPNIKLPESLD